MITQEELHELLIKGEVNFSFKKKDDSMRDVRGTLSETLIPTEKSNVDEHLSPTAKNLKFFDLDLNAWRSMAYDCSIIELR